ncbi:P-loop containing nucleoside triphosphate hydrolase protein [Podospora didyma]|uniref:Peroxisomal ATPase PEX6 n=1 Tax=Podospora didyma TaxID=330526 RepID=A0AAE0U878_9PEZI|nr:P-loop containing nucleoside triphosphate hydrolase protein [Podospora didyma]
MLQTTNNSSSYSAPQHRASAGDHRPRNISAMAVTDGGAAVVGIRKRRPRRRRQDKPALSARLVLDDHVKSDVGIISEDLFADLFPHLRDYHEQGDQPNNLPSVVHVAIAPWAPNHAPETTSWAVVPVTKSSALAPSTVQFSPSSFALQSFAANLKQVAPSRLTTHSRSGIEILVLDVAAIELDTVFVNLEGDLAKRLEDGEGTFFREHPTNGKAKVAAAASPEDRLTAALRTALGGLKVVHAGDLFPLPLPPHSVTHVPPNPGKITLCEPVAQGILSPNTKIIVSRGRAHSKHNRGSAPYQPGRNLNGVGEEDEDTANDLFFSAAEERSNRTDAPVDETDFTATETESDGPDAEEEGELSDDSMDDMISLQTPTLPAAITSGMPGTPLTVGRGRMGNGMSGPGSVFSSYTATTARPDRPRGRLFKAQGLIQPIAPDILHPKPAPEDDEEARVYIDMRDLARVGCFSGDWVRVEASEEPPSNGLGAFGLGSFADQDPDELGWRPARVFGLPEGYSSRPVTRIASSKYDGRRLSFFESQIQKPSDPTVYLSPVLMANLEGLPYLRLSPIKRTSSVGKGLGQSKLAAPLQPPFAREVILHHVRTPIPVERDVQTAVMAGLKFYFEKRLRIIKSGDLIAVPIDTQLGRALQETTGGADESPVDDVLGLIASGRPGQNLKYDDVAWFRVGHVQPMKRDSPEDNDEDEDTWGSVACVDISMAHLEQTGSVTSRVPGTTSSTWPYYLGIKKIPKQPQSVSGPLMLEPERQFISPLRRRLRELLAAATSKPALHLKMPPLAILLVSTQRGIGKATTAIYACQDIGLHTFTVDAYDIVNDAGAGGSDVKTAGFLTTRAERAMSCGTDCCALLIRHIEALTADRMVSSIKEILADARVLIATTTEVEKVPDGIRALFTHELEMNAPDEGEREGILRTVLDTRGVALDPEVDLSGVALKTAALVAGDLVDVVERALVAQRARLEQLSEKSTTEERSVTVRDVQVAGGSAASGLTKQDFEVAVDAARKNFADAIGAPKIPNVTWDDVGGLNNVKEAVTETIQLPLERPELFAKGMKKRSGILFYGPPGTGKTLLAKAIATEYSLNFFSVKGPELLNMYIGESEANVRRVFQRARDARPCVVFFDELDSVAPKRGNQGDSGGVMDRIVSQLLAELDGMSGGGEDNAGGVFVIGATNRPDLLDQALLRPGRFDKMLYLGVSDTHDKQLKIMEALTRKFTLHPSVSLRTVAEKLPFTYTGADFYALCSDAMLKAVTRQASQVDAKIRAINQTKETAISTAAFFDHYATPDDVAVMVTEQDFLDAHRELIPSVSAGELAHYERVRATFEGGGVDNKSQQQQQQKAITAAAAPPPLATRRTVSGASRGSAKGKGKAVDKGGKGKGKAVAMDSDDFEEEDDYDDEEVNGAGGAGGGGYRDKGKATTPFRDGTASDDEGLYD